MYTVQSNKMCTLKNNKLKNLNTQDLNKLYFTVNQICNKKTPSKTANLKIPTDRAELVRDAGIPIQEIKIENNNLHITTLDHKLKLIGSQFERIHTKNLINSNSTL